MGKVRISISLDPEEAERVRTHADRAGMDVSAYLVNAATRQMAETEATEAKFAKVDALIADAEAEAEHLALPDEPDAGSLAEDERHEVDAAVRLVYGTGDASSQGQGEVA